MALPAGFDDFYEDESDEFEFGYDAAVERDLESAVPVSVGPQQGPVPLDFDAQPKTVTLSDLQTAVAVGSVDIVQRYLAQDNCDVDAILPSGWTGLLHAANSAQPETTRLLLEHGANANFHKSMFTALMGACVATGRDENVVECVRLLVAHGARVDAHDHCRTTALMFAARESRLEAVRLLLEHKADANRQDSRGWSVLCWATQRGNIDVVRYLLNHGADAELPCNDGQTPLDLAYACDHTDVVDLLEASLHPLHSNQHVQMEATSVIPPVAQPQICARYGDLELFLCGLELSSLVPVFQQHQINLSALLRMRDYDLEKVGIPQLGVRKKILEAVGQLHKKEWDVSNLDEQFATVIGVNEATVILGNVAKHIGYISATVEYVTRQIAANPHMIDPSPLVEATQNLASNLKQACHSVDSLKQKTEDLQTQVNFIAGMKQTQVGHSDRKERKWSFVRVGILAVAAVVVGRTVYARLAGN